MDRYKVKNVTRVMKCFNLKTKNGKGRQNSLILSRGEESRPLSKAEFKSPEIQAAIRKRDLRCLV